MLLLRLQTCCWQFLAFQGTFKIVLSVSEEDATRQVRFSLVGSSSFMRDFQGTWRVLDHPRGRPDRCTVHHVLSVKPVMDVPPPVAAYMKTIFVKQVSEQPVCRALV